MDAKGTVVVEIKLRKEVGRVLELGQRITGCGMGELIEGAVARRLWYWRSLVAWAVREGELELAPDAMELEVVGLKLVRLGREERRRAKARGKSESVVIDGKVPRWVESAWSNG